MNKFFLFALITAVSLGLTEKAQGMMVSTFLTDLNNSVAAAAKQLCNAQLVDADQVPIPPISDADQVFYRQKVITGYLVNRATPMGIGQIDVSGWHFLTPQGGEISTELYNTSGPATTTNYPLAAGKWANLSTDRGGQVAYLTQYGAVADGVGITRWNGLCGNQYAPNWDDFDDCVKQNFTAYTAARICQGS
jgi:hypothetical protein